MLRMRLFFYFAKREDKGDFGKGGGGGGGGADLRANKGIINREKEKETRKNGDNDKL